MAFIMVPAVGASPQRVARPACRRRRNAAAQATTPPLATPDAESTHDPGARKYVATVV